MWFLRLKREASWCIISRRLIKEQASQSGRRPLSDFDEAHGVVGPIHFIEILEENRCSHLIDLFVLDEVCKAQKLRCISDRRVVPVSVNFSKIHWNMQTSWIR